MDMPAFALTSMASARRRLLASLLLCAGLISLAAPPMAIAQTRELPDFTDLADKWSPSVVNIRTLERGRVTGGGTEIDPNMEEFFRRFGIP
jgi:serine protease Do